MSCRRSRPFVVALLVGFALTGCFSGSVPATSDAGGTAGDDGTETPSVTSSDTAETPDDGEDSTSAESTGGVETPTETSVDGDSSSEGGEDSSTTDSGDATDDSGSSDGGSSSSGGVMAIHVEDLLEGDLVITEIMYNPDFCPDADCEWLEIYNDAGAPVDLDGLIISDVGAASGEIGESIVLPPGEYGVLAAGNGGAWGYSFEPLAHYGAGGPFFDERLGGGDLIEISNGDISIDVITYTATGELDAGTSLELDSSALDVKLNDDESHWCLAETNFGDGDLGSPGAANGACP